MQLVGTVHLVRGNHATINAVLALLQREGIETRGNPDIYVREYVSFGVEEARELALRASSRALAHSRRVFIVVTPSMTNEAQNALLKTLEEPMGDALFFIIVPSPLALLPTLRSRAQLLELDEASSEAIVDAGAFLRATPAKRIDMLKPLLEKTGDDKRDLQAIIQFLTSLEMALAPEAAAHREGLAALYRTRQYLNDKGALVKPLLEHIALLV